MQIICRSQELAIVDLKWNKSKVLQRRIGSAKNIYTKRILYLQPKPNPMYILNLQSLIFAQVLA